MIFIVIRVKAMTKNSERKEAWMRLLVFVVTGIILYFWGILSCVLMIINWLIMVFAGKRNQQISEFIEIWNSTMYSFIGYISGMSNNRPFPFNKLNLLGKFKK